MIMSPTVVHCAVMDLISEARNKGPTGPSICKITNTTEYLYESASTQVQNIVSYFVTNAQSYGEITY
jgi:hypothetical protein